MDNMNLQANPNINVKVTGTMCSCQKLPKIYNTVILTVYIKDGESRLIQSNINKPNTKYVVKYNFTLANQTITIPEGCILDFDGGSFSNGTLVCNDTIIVSDLTEEQVLININLEGTFIKKTRDEILKADEEDVTNASGLIKFKDKEAGNGMGKIILRNNIVKQYPSNTWMFTKVKGIVYLLYSYKGKVYAIYNSDEYRGLVLKNNVVKETLSYHPENLPEIVEENYLTYTTENNVHTITLPDGSTITSTVLDSTEMFMLDEIEKVKVNLLTQSMLDKENTIYVIKYDFELRGETVTIPSNCVLEFDGGSLKNGIVVLNDTYIEGVEGFGTDITLTGTCSNTELCSNVYKLDTTGVKDCTVAVQSLVDVCKFTLVFSKGIYKFNRVSVEKDITIDGNGATFHSDILVSGYSSIKNVITIQNTGSAILKNIHFEGDNNGTFDNDVHNETPVHFIKVDYVEICNCTFSKYRNHCNLVSGVSEYNYLGNVLTCTGCNHVEITNCEFFDNNGGEWIWISPSEDGSYLTENSMCVFSRNYIHNYENDTVRSNTPICIVSSNVHLCDNTIEYYTYKGSAVNAIGKNVIIQNNIIRFCHFTAGFDTCEWGQYYNDVVEISGNTVEVYNGNCCVVNSKRVNIYDNILFGLNAVTAYCTYKDANSINNPTSDDCIAPFGGGESFIVKNNKINADYYDLEWKQGNNIVKTYVTHCISINGQRELGKNVFIDNNDITVHSVVVNSVELINKTQRQPVFIRNFEETVSIENNKVFTDCIAIGSSVDTEFIYIQDSLEYICNCISVCNNTIISDTNNATANYLILTRSADDTTINCINDVILKNNIHLKKGNTSKIVSDIRYRVIDSLTIAQMPSYDYGISLHAAAHLSCDFFLNIEDVATPKTHIGYMHNGVLVYVYPGVTPRCFAKYYINGNQGDILVDNKTLHIGDILRVSSTCIYLLLSNSCAFTDDIPSVTDTTNNKIVTWAGARWLVLSRARAYPYGVGSGGTLPNLHADETVLWGSPSTRTIALLTGGGKYDYKGWRNLGIKGNTTTMLGLSVTGSDEGYLFYNTDIKLWCQMYIDRSTDATICWQILGNGRGLTAQRPTVLTSLFGLGFQYFDTDLGKPIFWNTNKWIFADGTDVPTT